MTVVATIVFVGSLLALVAMGSGGPLADDLVETITVFDPSGILMAVSIISFVGSVVSGGATVYFARKERAAFDKDETLTNNTQESETTSEKRYSSEEGLPSPVGASSGEIPHTLGHETLYEFAPNLQKDRTKPKDNLTEFRGGDVDCAVL